MCLSFGHHKPLLEVNEWYHFKYNTWNLNKSIYCTPVVLHQYIISHLLLTASLHLSCVTVFKFWITGMLAELQWPYNVTGCHQQWRQLKYWQLCVTLCYSLAIITKSFCVTSFMRYCNVCIKFSVNYFHFSFIMTTHKKFCKKLTNYNYETVLEMIWYDTINLMWGRKLRVASLNHRKPNTKLTKTSSFAVAERLHDASCLSVVSFNSTRRPAQSFIVSLT